jgi:hypothetical protein
MNQDYSSNWLAGADPTTDPQIQDLYKHLHDAENARNQAMSGMTQEAPPRPHSPSYGTKDLIPLGIAALTALLGGQNGQGAALGFVGGYQNRKKEAADQANQTDAQAYDQRQRQRQSTAQIAQQGVEDARFEATQTAKNDASDAKTIEAMRKRLFEPKTDPAAIPGIIRDLAAKGVTYPPETVKALAEGSYYVNNKIADTANKGARTDNTVAKTETENAMRPGKVEGQGLKNDRLTQLIAFHKNYDPKAVARVDAQVQSTLKGLQLSDARIEQIHQRVQFYPLEYQMKAAKVHADIDAKEAAAAKVGKPVNLMPEYVRLFGINQKVIDSTTRKQAMETVSPEELAHASLLQKQNESLRQLMTQDVERKRQTQEQQPAPQGMDKSGGFAPFQVSPGNIEPTGGFWEKAKSAAKHPAVGQELPKPQNTPRTFKTKAGTATFSFGK